jgi:hypothetical protein
LILWITATLIVETSKDVAMVEKIRRLRMPQRKNRRNLFFGLLIISASLAGVWFAIESNKATEDFLVAAKPASSGSVVTAGTFRVEKLNLAGSSALYMRPGDVPLGSYLLNAFASGQLVPKGSVATSIIDARQPVIISSVMPVPQNLKVGDYVDIWLSAAIENNKFASAVMLVRDAEVTNVIASTGVVTEQSPKVQLLVPVVSVAPILDSIASKSALSLVLRRNLGND